MFTHNPLHGSGQAGFPHPALALGDDAHTAQGKLRMTRGRCGSLLHFRMTFAFTTPRRF